MPESEVFDSIGFLLIRTMRSYRNLVRQEVLDFGLHRGQPHVLLALQCQEGLSNSELAEFLEITPATLTNKIKRMEKAGWLIRRRDADDERVSRIYLTDQGRGMLESLGQAMGDIERIVRRDFSQDDIQCMKTALNKIIANIDIYTEQTEQMAVRHSQVDAEQKENDIEQL